MIAAVQDQSSGIRWHNGSFVTTGATGTAVGTGATNTTTIISVQGATETSYAAGLARAYTGGGYTDWFLPSKDELNLMYTKRVEIGNFTGVRYWSSTEYVTSHAWDQIFNDPPYNGNSVFDGKGRLWNVRAIRAF